MYVVPLVAVTLVVPVPVPADAWWQVAVLILLAVGLIVLAMRWGRKR